MLALLALLALFASGPLLLPSATEASTFTVQDTAQQGQTLTAVDSGAGPNTRYQWYHVNADTNENEHGVRPAYSPSYTLTAGDMGYKMRVLVNGVFSEPTSTVVAPTNSTLNWPRATPLVADDEVRV